jgi:hypothetical protein
MKTGDVVNVKLFGGLVESRVVVQVEQNTVVICNQEEWRKATNEKRMAEGIRLGIDDLEVSPDISTDRTRFAQF